MPQNRTKPNNRDQAVLWLNLKNANESILQKLVEDALKRCNVTEREREREREKEREIDPRWVY